MSDGGDQMPLNPDPLNRLSVSPGAAGQADYATPTPGVMAPDLRTGEMLGARVARLAARLRASA